MERLLIIFTLTFSLNAFSISIITDLDDTIKITNVNNKPEALFNALFNRSAFRGMPELLEDFSRQGDDLYVVTASPNLFTNAINEFLEVNEITVKQLYTRKLSELGRKEQYKLASIREIITSHPDEYILLGDDTQIDAKVYAKIKSEFPEQVKAFYIHQVSGGKDLPGIKFYTAFDIAVSEYKAGRIGRLELLDQARKFILIRDLAEIFPVFKFCPTNQDHFDTDLDFGVRTAALLVYKRITEYCKSRDL